MKYLALFTSLFVFVTADAVTVDTTHNVPECAQMLQAINDADGNALTQLDLIEKTEEEMCFNGDASHAANQLRNPLLRSEAERLYSIAVESGELARFDAKQRARLRPHAQYVDTLMQHTSSKRSHWLLALLQYVQKYEKKEIPKNQQLLWTDEILNGYVDDKSNEHITAFLKASEIERFLVDVNDFNVVDATGNNRRIAFPKNRSPEDSAQVRYVKYRSAFAPVTMNTVIDMEYDSTKMTNKGKKQYNKALSVFKENSTKRILIIGHASPKGNDKYNCQLSKKRALAIQDKILADTKLSADKVKIVWAGENIPLDFGQAKNFIQRDIQVLDSADADDPMRRRVEFEINGKTLLEKYAGKLCK